MVFKRKFPVIERIKYPFFKSMNSVEILEVSGKNFPWKPEKGLKCKK